MRYPKLSPTLFRIIGISFLIVIVAVAVKTGSFRGITRQIRAAVWHSQTPWSLEIDLTFLKCDHHLNLENVYPSETAIRNYLKRHPEYRLAKEQTALTRNRLSGAEDLDDYCPTCRSKQFLGIRKQQVMVLRGTPGQPGPVKEKITIQAHLLPAAELADLQKGIPFRDEKEKLQIIEGLNGLVTN